MFIVSFVLYFEQKKSLPTCFASLKSWSGLFMFLFKHLKALCNNHFLQCHY